MNMTEKIFEFKRKCTWALGSLRGVGSSAHYPGMIAVKYIKIIIIDNIFHKYIKYGYSSTYYVTVLQLYQGVCNNLAVQYLY